VTYHLRNDLTEKVVVKVADSTGKPLTEITGPSTAGVHRVNWDLRIAGKEGAVVKPGRYTVTLYKTTVAGTAPVGDPQVVELVSPDVGTASK
jgi:hypothetical protein